MLKSQIINAELRPANVLANHKRAGQFVSRLLFTAARRQWRENRGLLLGRIDLTNNVEAAAS